MFVSSPICYAGRPITQLFGRLRKLAKVSRQDGLPYHPRLRDFRPTFAVHRIGSWIDDGMSLDKMLPALAAYLGHAGLEATEQFLSLTPGRFNKQISTLSPQRGKKHWRDDPELMSFLAMV